MLSQELQGDGREGDKSKLVVWFNGPVTPLTIFVKTRLRNVQAGALSRGSVLFHRKSTSADGRGAQ